MKFYYDIEKIGLGISWSHRLEVNPIVKNKPIKNTKLIKTIKFHILSFVITTDLHFPLS